MKVPNLSEAPPPSSARARSVMVGNRSESALERRLRSALHAHGLRFRKDSQPLPDVRCRADVVFSRARIAVFVDGCFWHRCPIHGSAPMANSEWWRAKLDRTVARDRERTRELEEAGWTVLRLWEHEEISAMVAKVIDALACATNP